MNKPIAVLISDIHFNIQTLEVADKALSMAVNKANELGIPLIIAGDLHDTKANIRGECIKTLMTMISLSNYPPYILRGNHCSINERSKEHALEFLKSIARVISDEDGYWFDNLFIRFKAYEHDPEAMRSYLKTLPKGSTLIMHQGVQDAESGHYFIDKSSILKQDLASFRVISGHYHTRQSFSLPEGGRFDYLGNPYTLGFGEADDPEKGFQVLYDDGSLEFIPTNLRKHIIINVQITPGQNPWEDHFLYTEPKHSHEDIISVRVKAPSDYLAKNVTKDSVTKMFELTQSFKLDLIPTDTKTSKQQESQNLSQAQILDNLIDSLTNTDDNRKARLKELWKNFKE